MPTNTNKFHLPPLKLVILSSPIDTLRVILIRVFYFVSFQCFCVFSVFLWIICVFLPCY